MFQTTNQKNFEMSWMSWRVTTLSSIYDSPPKKSSLLGWPKLDIPKRDIEYLTMIHEVSQLGKHKSGVRNSGSVFWYQSLWYRNIIKQSNKQFNSPPNNPFNGETQERIEKKIVGIHFPPFPFWSVNTRWKWFGDCWRYLETPCCILNTHLFTLV